MRSRVDLVTGRTSEVQDWDPDPDQAASSVAPTYEVRLVPSEDYGAYLEARALPLVRDSPHRCWKSVDSVKLGILQELLTGASFERF
jgi:hypothetical protein